MIIRFFSLLALTVTDLEGIRVVRLNPPESGTKLFQFHGGIFEKSGKILKTNPLLMDLNPSFRNFESALINLVSLHMT